MMQQQTFYIDPKEWQRILLQGQIEAIAEQQQLFTWVDNKHTEPTLTGPKTTTLSFSNSWTTQEGLEELQGPKTVTITLGQDNNPCK